MIRLPSNVETLMTKKLIRMSYVSVDVLIALYHLIQIRMNQLSSRYSPFPRPRYQRLLWNKHRYLHYHIQLQKKYRLVDLHQFLQQKITHQRTKMPARTKKTENGNITLIIVILSSVFHSDTDCNHCSAMSSNERSTRK